MLSLTKAVLIATLIVAVSASPLCSTTQQTLEEEDEPLDLTPAKIIQIGKYDYEDAKVLYEETFVVEYSKKHSEIVLSFEYPCVRCQSKGSIGTIVAVIDDIDDGASYDGQITKGAIGGSSIGFSVVATNTRLLRGRITVYEDLKRNPYELVFRDGK